MSDPLRHGVLNCHGHILVLGGPGSGKTTLALHKAAKRIERGLVAGQSVLFLSFSRAAVARILSAAPPDLRKRSGAQLSIQTFHAFFWNILKAHAYLLGARRRPTLLSPQDEKAISGGSVEGDAEWITWQTERERLFLEEGRIAFDLFAANALALLKGSEHIRGLVARRHPLIIVDEAQDTGQHAWDCVQLLAPTVQVMCLADLEQQIFDYLPGVGPERIAAIRDSLNPHEVDLGSQNHRSPNTEILGFGNDILNGKRRGSPYKGIAVISYRPEKPPPNWNHLLRRALSQLYTAVRAASEVSPRTVAVLVSTNRSALKVSNALNAVGIPSGKPVRHKLLFDEAEALLSARFAAFLLEPGTGASHENDVATCMLLIADAKRATGKGLKDVAKLREQAEKIRSGTALNIKIANALRALIFEIRNSAFTGDPARDWLEVKRLMRASGQPELERCASQLDFLVAFQRGHRISAALSSEWLRDGAYTRARLALDTALAQEQLLDGFESTNGLQVMNFHKAKGKQFDGVIIVRESRWDVGGAVSSFVWRGDHPPYAKSRKVLRVAITRASNYVVILDPLWPPCPIMTGHNL